MKRPVEFDRMRINTAVDAMKNVWIPDFADPQVAVGFLPICLKGGIGDAIVALPLIKKVQEIVGQVKVYTNYPDLFREIGEESLLGDNKYFPGFDHWLSIETAPRFYFERNFNELRNPGTKSLFDNWVKLRDKYPELARFMHYQPNFDHEIGLEAVKHGLTRNTLPGVVMGLGELPYPKLNIESDPMIDLGPFITVHDGFDLSQTDIKYRSTKSWNIKHWARFVKLFKDWNKNVSVVQIGSGKSRPIPGVDHDFRGIFTIGQSISLLKKSKLHIDGDSGLVHAAHAMGVKSVVLFGSTPSQFFGYPDNVNVDPKICGGCWWLTRSWMKKCFMYETGPKCMDSIDPVEVSELANKALWKEDKNG